MGPMAHKRGSAESRPLTLLEGLGWAESVFRTGLCAEKRCTMPLREEILLCGGPQPCSGSFCWRASNNEALTKMLRPIPCETEALGKWMLSQRSLFWGRRGLWFTHHGREPEF